MSIPELSGTLAEETRLLAQLSELLVKVRQIRPDREALVELLDAQASLCQALAERQATRSAVLAEAGYGPRDLLVALLNHSPKEAQEAVVAAFRGFVSAAEHAQSQIDINREFFAVALSAVEDALMSVSPESRPATYDTGGGRKPRGSVMVSTST